jgi:LysR family transcriptional regulator (chromosome initiation inhibitor)
LCNSVVDRFGIVEGSTISAFEKLVAGTFCCKNGTFMKFDYESLSVLSAVVRTGSFEAAAKSLNVTQSAVSQRIRQLEEKTGTMLILRGRPCVGTEDGLILCRHFEEVSLLEHDLRQRINVGQENAVRSAPTSIRISVNSDSLATWFPEVVGRAASELNLRLEVIPDDQEFTEDRLRSGDALAVVTSSEKSVPGCKSIALGVMEYMAVASPAFMEQYLPDTIGLREVSRAPSIQFDRKDTLPMQWLEKAFGFSEGLISHSMPSYEGHLQCCLKSIGWALMPSITVAPLIKQNKLVEVLPNIRLNIPLYWQCRASASGPLEKLNEVVHKVANEALLHDV